MAIFLFFLVALLIMEMLMIGISIGIGYLIRWMLPSIDLGMAILTGAVTSIASGFFLIKLLSMTGPAVIMNGDDEDDEEDDEDEQDARGRGSRAGVYSFDQFAHRKRRKRRK